MASMETYYGQVRTPQDAIILFEACRLGILPRVQRRLSEKERQQIRSGSVFVWDEREAGMRRWTDGKSWSASRVSGSFLTYREMEGKRGFSAPTTNPRKFPGSHRSSDNGHETMDEGPDGYRYKPDGLMKQSFSITTHDNRHLHLINYYSRGPGSPNLQQPQTDPALRNIRPQKGMYPESNLNEGNDIPAVTRGPLGSTPGWTSAPAPHYGYHPTHHYPPAPPPPPPHGYPPNGYPPWPPSPAGTPGPYSYYTAPPNIPPQYPYSSTQHYIGASNNYPPNSYHQPSTPTTLPPMLHRQEHSPPRKPPQSPNGPHQQTYSQHPPQSSALRPNPYVDQHGVGSGYSNISSKPPPPQAQGPPTNGVHSHPQHPYPPTHHQNGGNSYMPPRPSGYAQEPAPAHGGAEPSPPLPGAQPVSGSAPPPSSTTANAPAHNSSTASGGSAVTIPGIGSLLPPSSTHAPSLATPAPTVHAHHPNYHHQVQSQHHSYHPPPPPPPPPPPAQPQQQQHAQQPPPHGPENGTRTPPGDLHVSLDVSRERGSRDVNALSRLDKHSLKGGAVPFKWEQQGEGLQPAVQFVRVEKRDQKAMEAEASTH